MSATRAVVERPAAHSARAVGVGTYSGNCKATGRESTARFAHALEVRGGKVVRFEQVVDSAERNKAL